MNDKYLLYDRINRLDESFKYPMKKLDECKHYARKLNEGRGEGIFSELTEVFLNHNKLSGNVKEDQSFLNEFISLMEEEDFDPFAHLKGKDKINEKEDCLLYISKKNEKLDHPYFSLPAGYTCQFADICKTFVPRNRKKIDNKLLKQTGDLRCYAASMEALRPEVQANRWRNMDLLDKFDGAGKVDLIMRSLDEFEKNNGKFDVFRIHESGDFYEQEYFDSWVEVARQRSDILFYAYTKALPFWVKRMYDLPSNIKLIASVGGTEDELISKHDLRYAVVVNSPEEAKQLHLPIDIDDTLAHNHDGNFALLIHGTQKKGSEEMKAAKKNAKIVKKLKRGEFDDL